MKSNTCIVSLYVYSIECLPFTPCLDTIKCFDLSSLIIYTINTTNSSVSTFDEVTPYYIIQGGLIS